MEDKHVKLGETIWNYMSMGHELEKSDVILAFGSHDRRVAEYAAELWHQRWAPWLVFSGGLGNLTEGVWDRPEADIFHDIAVAAGVPSDRILVENKASNSGQNVLLSYKLLQEHNIPTRSIILVQKPYMERRAYATFMKQWPGNIEETSLYVTSPRISFQDYANDEVGQMKNTVEIMLSDLYRVRTYPEKGFQIHQEIPPKVWEAYEKLMEAGYKWKY
ncbi:uncharacterized protein SCO4629-like [Branchiostoma floridae]|uniref:Uncharacterized protein SCO4629-like n=1 Tax=Branchiostoma floridae TaxID=7739 RepID=A0A9J7MV13_BRAFL|nr:uncharacterized protein SCO4629-like [Branchiostoma floridae]